MVFGQCAYAIRPSRSAKAVADASTTHASHAVKRGLNSHVIAVPATPRLFPPIRLVSIGCRAVCAVVTGSSRVAVGRRVSSAGRLGLRDSRVGGQMHR